MLKLVLLFISFNGVFSQEKINSSSDKSKASSKTSKTKRFVYTDEQKDNIMVLDLAIRNQLKDALKNKNQSEEDVWSSFYKESAGSNTSAENSNTFEIYIIESGDDWQSISQKIYNDKKFWPHLQSWNEELLKNIDLPAGAELKYLKDIKDETDSSKKK